MSEMSKSDIRNLWRIRKQRREALAAYPGFDVRVGFVVSYYACYRALYRRKAGNMPDTALRLYMRFCRVAVAEHTAMRRDDLPPERRARLSQLRERAWMAYRASDRDGDGKVAA